MMDVPSSPEQEDLIENSDDNNLDADNDVVYIDEQGNQVEPEEGAVYIDEYGNMVVGKQESSEKEDSEEEVDEEEQSEGNFIIVEITDSSEMKKMKMKAKVKKRICKNQTKIKYKHVKFHNKWIKKKER